MAEYIQNGDFNTGDLDPWFPRGTATVERDINRQRYHVHIEKGTRIQQHWRMDEPHDRLLFLMDIKVEGGSGVPSGGVQVSFFFSGGSGGPISTTYNIKESSEWETLDLLLNAGADAASGNITLLVQPAFADKVTITNISLMGVTREQDGFRLSKYAEDDSNKQ